MKKATVPKNIAISRHVITFFSKVASGSERPTTAIMKAVCYGRPFSFREGGLTYGNHKNHAASCRQGPHRKSGDQ